MAKLSTDALLDAFKEMTLLELSEFVKVFEETFDVTAAAPVAVAVAAPAGGGGEARQDQLAAMHGDSLCTAGQGTVSAFCVSLAAARLTRDCRTAVVEA